MFHWAHCLGMCAQLAAYGAMALTELKIEQCFARTYLLSKVPDRRLNAEFGIWQDVFFLIIRNNHTLSNVRTNIK